jgi:hypothetical protein
MEEIKFEGQSAGDTKIMTKVDVCNVEGCGKPRMRNRQGKMLTMCETHQKDYWRKQAANKRNRRPAKAAKQNDNGQPPPIVGDGTAAAALDHFQRASIWHDEESRQVFPESAARIEAVLKDEAQPAACAECGSKRVIEALRAKSPKLAKLIDAMQAEVEAARELGL